jgi:signal peptidase I
MEDSRYKKLIDHVILEQLGKGKTFTFTVTGNSMHPLIREGDPIQIEQCKPRDLSMGDIITFKKDDLYVTHRVLWIMRRRDGTTLLTKGDNEITIDPLVLPNQIVGKAVAIKRANRTLDLKSPCWRFINLFLGTIFVMETIFILSYRFAASTFILLKILANPTSKPFLLYRHLKNRGLRLAARIID